MIVWARLCKPTTDVRYLDTFNHKDKTVFMEKQSVEHASTAASMTRMIITMWKINSSDFQPPCTNVNEFASVINHLKKLAKDTELTEPHPNLSHCNMFN